MAGAMTASAPRRFGKYQISQKLGSGAMGVVYLAYDPVIQRHVAVKTIRKDVLQSPAVNAAAERFRREASAAGRLSHPGIVAVYDYGEDADVAYIVMEYTPGLELGAYVAKHRPSLGQIASLMRELFDALGYAHACGVVHRDIKPANILISDRLKITDFGVARVDGASHTQTGIAVGTPAYMAPEQFMGKGIDHRVDLFAAGVVLYELLTGTLPFVAQSLEELCYKICHAEPASATSLAPGLPQAIDAVLSRALAKSKAARFDSAEEFQRALSAALPESSSEPPARPAHVSMLQARIASSAWSTQVLDALEGVLVPVIGSVSRAVVRRCAVRAQNAGELLQLLSDAVAAEPTHAALVAQLRRVLGGSSSAPAPAPASGASAQIAVTPEAVARVTRALASYVGPIAKVMIKRTAAESASYLDLCLRLSERLSSDAEKAQFLREVGVP